MGYSIYVAVYARRVRVPGGSKFHMAPGTIYHEVLITTSCLDSESACVISIEFTYVYCVHVDFS